MYCQKASRMAIRVPFFMPTILWSDDYTWNFGGLLIKLNLTIIVVSSADLGNLIWNPSCSAKFDVGFFHLIIYIIYCLECLIFTKIKKSDLFEKRCELWYTNSAKLIHSCRMQISKYFQNIFTLFSLIC